MHECGDCYQCCIDTGVEAKPANGRIGLRTYAGDACIHLNPDTPHAACAVYSRRPAACERYRCMWLQNEDWPAELRPDISGVILGLYDLDDVGFPTSATIAICNEDKCGSLGDPYNPLGQMITVATQIVPAVFIVDYRTRKVITLRDGKVYGGRLLKPSGPEDLNFECNMQPIGDFEIKTTT